MTIRNRSKIDAGRPNSRGISRRDVLRASAAMIPAGIILRPWVAANAQTPSATFDYYVSPSGSDSNAGTLAAPWAITSLSLYSHTSNNVANCRSTAGKRVGFLPGTYDISSLMNRGAYSEATGALQLIGGTSTNMSYWGSSDSSGVYSPRTATLDAKGASGLFGGGHSSGPGVTRGPMIAHCGSYPSNYAVGFATVDGLRLTGGSFMGIRVGGGSSGDGPTITNPVVIQNCEFTGFGFNAGDALDNTNQAWLDHNTNAITYSNNWHHDNYGPHGTSNTNGDHFNAIQVWGFGGICTGTLVQYNTCVNSGNIYGKEGGIQGSIIQNNYVDMSMFTAENSVGIQDFTGNGQSTSGLTVGSVIRNNICIVYGGTPASWDTLGGISTLSSDSVGWMTPCQIYNNTIVNTSTSGALFGITQVNLGSAGVGAIQFYNNILYYPRGGSGSLNGVGNYRTNPHALALQDYNLVPSSGISWAISQNASPSSTLSTYSSMSAFSSGLAANGGISGAEAHSLAGTPTFVGTGTEAAQYKLASGSIGKGAGSTTGRGGGVATDMGAWGNGAAQIGCNFTSGTTVPNAPALKVS